VVKVVAEDAVAHMHVGPSMEVPKSGGEDFGADVELRVAAIVNDSYAEAVDGAVLPEVGLRARAGSVPMLLQETAESETQLKAGSDEKLHGYGRRLETQSEAQRNAAEEAEVGLASRFTVVPERWRASGLWADAEDAREDSDELVEMLEGAVLPEVGLLPRVGAAPMHMKEAADSEAQLLAKSDERLHDGERHVEQRFEAQRIAGKEADQKMATEIEAVGDAMKAGHAGLQIAAPKRLRGSRRLRKRGKLSRATVLPEVGPRARSGFVPMQTTAEAESEDQPKAGWMRGEASRRRNIRRAAVGGSAECWKGSGQGAGDGDRKRGMLASSKRCLPESRLVTDCY